MSYEQFYLTMLSFKNVVSVSLVGSRIGIRYINGGGYFPIDRTDKMNEAINNCQTWAHKN
jgi:hypothetical protein